MVNLIARFALVGALLAAFLPPAVAQGSAATQVGPGVSYQFLERWDVDRLNRILQVDTPAFAGIPVSYSPARNAVRLYRVTYNSVAPERGNKQVVASGLLAVPDTQETSFPMVSYQHGTVYLREQVPSMAVNSPETQLMIAQFAGQGYAVIGADYFGMGTSTEPEGYMVMASHQQACHDLLLASRAVLGHLKLSASKLFLGGWSQGGAVTMAFLQKLERAGEKPLAAATAAGPLDLVAMLNGILSVPRPEYAPWLTTIVILSAFSYETYYGASGLARSVINDAAYDISRKAYERQKYDPADVPMDMRKLMRPEYFDPQFFAASSYGKLLKANETYGWLYRTPVRNYYGEKDEAIPVGVARLGMTYAQSMGTGNPSVQAISTGATTHRGTFATAVPQWKTWFDAAR